jgi:hypothetical protein
MAQHRYFWKGSRHITLCYVTHHCITLCNITLWYVALHYVLYTFRQALSVALTLDMKHVTNLKKHDCKQLVDNHYNFVQNTCYKMLQMTLKTNKTRNLNYIIHSLIYSITNDS